MSNQQATDRILAAVRSAKAEAQSAEREFDRRNRDIQRKASRSIDLFGGSATSQVVDIARDARRACDDLYTAYQSLVRSVDDQCKPLLDQDPAVSAVKEVRDLITWLNNESEIENNFTASLNSRSLGDVASVSYVPSIESKMIQRYWEGKYSSWPGRVEQESRQREEAAEQRRVREEAYRQAKERADEEYAHKVEAYEREYEEWQVQKRETERKRNARINETVEQERKYLQERLDRAYYGKREMLRRELAKLSSQKKESEEKLSKLGFFAFGEKSAAKNLIRECEERIPVVEEEIKSLDSNYAAWQKENQLKLEDFLRDTRRQVEREIPLPPEPRRPAAPAVKMPAVSVASSLPSVRLDANEAIKQAILDFMEPGKLYTITDLTMGCPACEDLTNQRCSALLRQMVPANVERTEDERKAYFRVVDPVLRTSSAPAYTPPLPNETRLTAMQIANRSIQEAILASMEPGKLYTVTDIMNVCPACEDLTNVRVSALVRQMIGVSLERIEDNRKAYFRLL